jgi:hypothetical protein
MLALIAMLALWAPAPAKELVGVSMPETVAVDGQTLNLNGMGLREATFLKIDVYVAALYLEKPTTDPESILDAQTSKQLRMRFVRKVSRKDMVGGWKDAVAKNSGDAAVAVQDRFERLYAAMTDVAEGDELIVTETAARGVSVSLKGKDLVTVPGHDFAKVLWSIWLGPHPPNPELKQGLLGKFD